MTRHFGNCFCWPAFLVGKYTHDSLSFQLLHFTSIHERLVSPGRVKEVNLRSLLFGCPGVWVSVPRMLWLYGTKHGNFIFLLPSYKEKLVSWSRSDGWCQGLVRLYSLFIAAPSRLFSLNTNTICTRPLLECWARHQRAK